MIKRIANIIVLVEDMNQENLLRRYLQRLGHETRSMRIEKLVGGRGSGEQFVREKYASEVRAIRSRMTRTKACLIAMIDADTGSVEDRMRQLERALKDAEEPSRMPTEAILNLIPRRNVETWILCLDSRVVDEQTDYRHDRGVNGLAIRNAAAALFLWTRSNARIPEICIPSLQQCLDEFKRLP